MPRRPVSRARAAMRASSDTEDLLPALDVAGRPHARGLEDARGGRRAPVDRRLGVAEPRGPELVEQQPDERVPVPAAARPVGHRDGGDDPPPPLAPPAALA